MVRTRSMVRYGSQGALTAANVAVARRLGGQVVQLGRRAYQSLTQSRAPSRAAKTTQSSVLTTQYDQSLRYRKKRMPKRKRRRWTSFVKRVRAVELAAQPLQFYGFQRSQRLTGGVNVQTVASAMLGGTTVANNDELYQIFQQAYATLNVADAADNIIYMKSISLDIQLSNVLSTAAIVDVYVLQARKVFNTAQSADAQWSAAMLELSSPTGGGTVNPGNVSTTLFDAPNFCSYWKILSKKEILLGAGQVTTMQIRNARNKRIDGKTLATAPQALPGYTKCMFFMVRGVPENVTTPRTAATDIVWSYQINVKYAIPPGKTQEAGRT